MLSTAQNPLPAFERVYRGQFDFVLRTLRALGVPESGLDDAVQDVFIVVHRRLPEFEGRASIKTWAYEIARRVALRYRTRAAQDAVRHAELPDRLRAGVDLEDAMERARASEVLLRFLAGLDEDRRRAFVLAELWEMSGREIAESLGINMNTVYARIRSAKTELDRVAHRMQVRNAGALTRSLRDRRASPATRDRAQAGVLAAVGSTAGPGAVGLATLAWAGLGVLACGLGVLAAVRLSEPGVSNPPIPAPRARVVSPRVEPETHLEVPVGVVAATVSPDVSVPNDAVAARASTSKPGLPVSGPPSLAEQLAAVQEIRAAVKLGDTVAARAKIAAYRKDSPGGAFTAEVDALHVELACRTKDPSAPTQLRAFAGRHRGSALVDRLTVLCSSKIGPQKPSSARTQEP